MSSIIVEKVNSNIAQNDLVKYRDINPYLKDLKYTEKANKFCSIRKLSDDEYLDLKTR
jgi:hypothetical protein